MDDLLSRLTKLQENCGGPNTPGSAAAAEAAAADAAPPPVLDEFQQRKKDISIELKNVREMIKERGQETDLSSQKSLELSQAIRLAIQRCKEGAQELTEMQRTEAAQKGKKPKKGKPVLTEEEIQRRAELVELIYEHIEEVEQLDRRRITGGGRGADGSSSAADDDSRWKLFATKGKSSGTGTSGTPKASSGNLPRDPTKSNLPEIDVQEGMRQVRANDQKMDEQLDRISAGVQVLGHMALDIRDELDKQDYMLDEITQKTDKANLHLLSVNRQLKDTVSKVRTGDKIIVDIILIVVLLAITGVVVKITI